MIKVDKNIPRSMTGYRGAALPNYPRTGDYPWPRMTVGDSFFVPLPDGGDIVRLMNRITGSGRAKFGAGKVSARCLFEGGHIGVRAWLIDEAIE